MGGGIVSPFVDIICCNESNGINLYNSNTGEIFLPTRSPSSIQTGDIYQLYVPVRDIGGIQLKQGQLYVFRVDSRFYVVQVNSYNTNNDNTVQIIFVGTNPTYVNKLRQDILYIVD